MNISSIIIVLSILFIHWIADFVCQSEEMSLGKSKSWDPLLEHAFTYSAIWVLPSMFYGVLTHSDYTVGHIIWFSPITFVCHTATDYYTSRVNAQLWDQKKTHQFFVSIGFDQFLHFTQLFLTFYLLTK